MRLGWKANRAGLRVGGGTAVTSWRARVSLRGRSRRFKVVSLLAAGLLAAGVATPLTVTLSARPASAEYVPDSTTTSGKEGIWAGSAASPTDNFRSTTFYAYVDQANEKFTFKTAYTGVQVGDTITSQPMGNYYAYTIKAPDGTVRTGTYGNGTSDPANLSYTATAAQVGVWKLTLSPVRPYTAFASGYADPQWVYDADISVLNTSGAQISGVVWTDDLGLRQNANQAPAQAPSFKFHVVTPSGAVYTTDLTRFNGMGSRVMFSAFGNVLPNSCDQAYGSYSYQSAENPSNWAVAPDSCGGNYHIFLNTPNSSLPASFANQDGDSFWILPVWQAPSKPVVTYTNTGKGTTTPFAGTITVTTDHFVGSFDLQIDTNGNNSYADPGDISVPVTVSDSPDTYTYAWDGKNALGSTVTNLDTAVTAQATLIRVDELHSDLQDVEVSGGQTMSQTAGYATGSAPLMWDDSYMKASATRSDAPLPGYTQSSGTTVANVHSWGMGMASLQAANGTGTNGSWGNNAYIDTWTYRALAVSTQTQTEIPLDYPALSLTKTAAPHFSAPAAPGDLITYTLTATNGGNATLTGVTISDPLVGSVPASAYTWPAPTHPGQLLVGQSVTATVSYPITQADINAGTVHNAATASGTDPSGNRVPSNEATTDTPIPQAPGLTLAKTASPTTVSTAGATVTYTFRATNSGNITLTNVGIAEGAFTGHGALSAAACQSLTNPSGSCGGATVASLAPGQVATFTATYPVAQEDIDAGVPFDNTATATGTNPKDPGRPVVSPPSTATVTPQLGASIDLTKSASPNDATHFTVGQTITYTFVVTNSGNIGLSNPRVNELSWSGDKPLGALSCPSTPALAPGAQMTCTATYTLDQADIDAGLLKNTATASGTPISGGGDVTSPQRQVTIPGDAAPALTLVKTASQATVTSAGTVITYSFKVTNSGNTTVTNISVSEDSFTGSGALSAVSCPGGGATVSSLAPGASATCAATYSVRQQDMDAGTAMVNKATASGSNPANPGTPVVSNQAQATVTPAQSPALTLQKSADPATVSAAGATVAYSFLVTNSGNVTVNNLSIAETAFSGTGTLGAASCPVTTLAPGASTACTAPAYTTTQPDIDAGTITNTAVANGKDPKGGSVASPPSTATVTATNASGLTLTKTASVATVSAAGTTVTYTFQVTNSGNITLTSIGVSEDSFTGSGSLSPVSCPAGAASLAPGASVTCTATYSVTQLDMDAAAPLVNKATAAGADPANPGTPVTSNQATATVTPVSSPALTLSKSAAPSTVAAVNTPVTYSFLVTNSGNVTVHNLSIAETAFTGSGALGSASCPATSLAPGESTTCTASYAVTQPDLDAGAVTNTAVANGEDPTGHPVVSPPSSARVDVTSGPALSLAKTASVATVSLAGAAVTYSFDITNNGNVTLTSVNVSEDSFNGSGSLSAVSCPGGGTSIASMAPSDSVTCTATYSVSQADLDAGAPLVNKATAHGTNLANPGTPVNSAQAQATVTPTSAPALTLVKSASVATVSKAGDSVTYSFDVTNSGNVTVNNLSIAETAFSGTGTLGAAACPATTLAPGASTTCTVTYSVTQADIDGGSVTNTAVASGKDRSGDPVASPPSTATVIVTSGPGLMIAKTATPSTVSKAGDSVTYRFVVTNSGNATVDAIAVHDGTDVALGTAFTGTGTLGAISCPAATLAPGASTTCTVTYAVTQPDVDAGAVDNTAVASGNDPKGNPVDSAPDSAEVTASPAPALALAKSANPTTYSKPGDPVVYSFLVTNTGNVTVNNLTINETAFSGTGASPAATCPVTTLAPAASTTCAADYAVTQADIDAGAVTNTAVASGTYPGDKPVASPPSSATVTADKAPALSLVKTADKTSVSTSGEKIAYTFVVTNTGNTTQTGVTVADSQASPAAALDAPPACVSLASPAGSCSGTSVTLRPGQAATFTATYTVTQADLDAGQVADAAVPQSTTVPNPPVCTGAGPCVPPPCTATASHPRNCVVVPVDQSPALDLAKSVTPTSVGVAGTPVAYRFVVTNSGNVTVNSLVINETAFSGSGALSAIVCPVSSLAPGASTTCTASYSMTQADIDVGTVMNTAVANGADPAGDAVASPPSSASVTVSTAPGLSLTKTADKSRVTAAGQVITYTFKVTNSGNTTQSGVTVADSLASPSDALDAAPACAALANPAGSCSGTTATLAPGQVATFTATYTVKQADLDAGEVADVAVPSSPTVPNPPVCDGSGTCAPPPCLPTDSNCVVVPVAQSPALTLTKSASRTIVDNAGDSVTYSFLVTNTGNVTIDNLTIHDGNDATLGTAFSGAGTPPVASCPVTTLAPGAFTTCAAAYAVTQADIDAGTVTNTAVASGADPSSAAVRSSPSSATVSSDKTPGLSLVKTADKSSVSAAGQVITYTFVVTNTGNTSQSGVSVADSLASPSVALDAAPACQSVAAPGGGSPVGACSADKSTASLAPDEAATFIATYTTTQADVDAGQVADAAVPQSPTVPNPPVCTGAGACAPPPCKPGDTDCVVIPTVQTPAMTLTKSVVPGSVDAAGQQVVYSFLLTNTGNVTIDNLTINETAFSGTGAIGALNCPVASLVPGAQTTCTAPYRVTQDDLDAGRITNTAIASGKDPKGGEVDTGPSSATVDGTASDGLSVVKSLAAGPNPVTAPGQVLTYRFLVENTGNQTLAGVTVADTQAIAGEKLDADPTCQSVVLAAGTTSTCSGATVASLAPGDRAIFTGTFTTTQADMDAGTVADSSVASGTPKPSTKDPHPRPLDSNPSDYQDPVDQNPALTAVKSPDQTTKHNVGDVITYTFMVTNTGNVTLGEVNVTDTQVAPAGALDGPISCPAGMVVLAPGRSITCTATYTVTQADVNNGSVADTAVAHGTPPIPAGSTTPPPPIDSAEASATVNIPSAPGLSVVKTASPSSYDAVGQTITYAFEVTNTGNVTENDITVTDSSFTGTGKLSAVTCPQPSLSAGESETCTATYTTTQADLDAGRISNSATVSGSPPPPPGTNTPPAEVVSPPSEVIEPAHARPGIAVVKTASTQTFVAGTTITYTFAVTNTGNVTLHNVTVTDVKFSGTGNLSAVTCPKGTTLPPGWRLTCAATYVATAADVAAGKLTNAATAAGVPPADGTGVTAKAVSSQEAVVLIDTHGSGTGTLINTGLGADAPANSGGVGLTLAGVLLGLLGAVCLLVIAGRGGRKEP